MRICEGFFFWSEKRMDDSIVHFFHHCRTQKKVSSDSGIQGNRNLQSS